MECLAVCSPEGFAARPQPICEGCSQQSLRLKGSFPISTISLASLILTHVSSSCTQSCRAVGALAYLQPSCSALAHLTGHRRSPAAGLDTENALLASSSVSACPCHCSPSDRPQGRPYSRQWQHSRSTHIVGEHHCSFKHTQGTLTASISPVLTP